jgi:hypothetical protein
MNNQPANLDQTDEELWTHIVSDEALEAASQSPVMEPTKCIHGYGTTCGPGKYC